MEYDGKSIADSQFCVEYIKKKRGIDASKHLSPAERGIARAFQKLTEENLYWYLYNILESSFFIYIDFSRFTPTRKCVFWIVKEWKK